jgi:hypothetical protein
MPPANAHPSRRKPRPAKKPLDEAIAITPPAPQPTSQAAKKRLVNRGMRPSTCASDPRQRIDPFTGNGVLRSLPIHFPQLSDGAR